MKFIKKECANWVLDSNTNEEYCLSCDHGEAEPFNDSYECWVMQGEYCPYFEKSVLGPPDYPYPPQGHNIQQVRRQYLPIAKKRKYFHSIAEYENWWQKGWGKAGQRAGNICNDCDIEIPSRKRYCESCRVGKNRASKRNWKRKHG